MPKAMAFSSASMRARPIGALEKGADRSSRSGECGACHPGQMQKASSPDTESRDSGSGAYGNIPNGRCPYVRARFLTRPLAPAGRRRGVHRDAGCRPVVVGHDEEIRQNQRHGGSLDLVLASKSRTPL